MNWSLLLPLRNLSLEEEMNENEATSWEASVARNLVTSPRASSPHLRKTSTLEDLKPDTDNDMIDVSDFLKEPLMIKGLLDLNKLTQLTQQLKVTAPHLKTVPHTCR